MPQNVCYEFERPAMTADVVLFMAEGGRLKILLIQRKEDPFKDYWALPGGFMNIDETNEHAAHRELQEETGLSGVSLTRIGLFDAVNRDPRGRSVTVAYTGLIDPDHSRLAVAGDDAKSLHWHDLDDLPPLAFDHGEIVSVARQAMKM